MTPSIVDIETTSNVGIPGMYIFQVDGMHKGKPYDQASKSLFLVVIVAHSSPILHLELLAS